MNLPRFTAETSLYRTAERYRTRTTSPDRGRRGVAPQATLIDPDCVNRCIMAGYSRRQCSALCRRPAWM